MQYLIICLCIVTIIFIIFLLTFLISYRRKKIVNKRDNYSNIYERYIIKFNNFVILFGGIENIEKCAENTIFIKDINLVNLKKLKEYKINTNVKDKEILISSKYNNISLFLSKITKEITLKNSNL